MERSSEFNNILNKKDIKIVYQPIVSLQNGDIYGYEALMRGPEDSSLRSPLELLEIAKKENKLFELEMLSREQAILGAKKMKKNKFLFINVEPDVVNDAHYKMGNTKEILDNCELSEKNIILEVTERTAIEDYSKYIRVIENYRIQGYKVAIDDVGSGYSGLTRINLIKPDLIKIDMDLVRNINKDSFKQSLIVAMVKFATNTGVKTIAEGIETKEELEALIKLGVNYGQGYYIARPDKETIDKLKNIKKEILDIIYTKEKINQYDIFTSKIGSIAEMIETVNPDTLCCELQYFLAKKEYEGICVVNDNNIPIGLVMQNELTSNMATQYGYSIYSKRSVSLLMDQLPTIVEYNTSLKRVSEIVTLRNERKVYDNIIVVKDGLYYGMVSIRKLLQHVTNIETNYAKHLNPLTMLPGNNIINNMITRYMDIDKKVAIGYVDLDNFKVYNDIYGFEKGDKVIKVTAKIIEKCINKYSPMDSFIGHIGGDDFVFIVPDNLEEISNICCDIINEFENVIKTYFSTDDILRGKIKGYDRDGLLKEHDLTSVSIGVYIGEINTFYNIEKFGEYMSYIKKMAKSCKGNSYLLYNEQGQTINQEAMFNI